MNENPPNLSIPGRMTLEVSHAHLDVVGGHLALINLPDRVVARVIGGTPHVLHIATQIIAHQPGIDPRKAVDRAQELVLAYSEMLRAKSEGGSNGSGTKAGPGNGSPN